jgi:hypothetical protein
MLSYAMPPSSKTSDISDAAAQMCLLLFLLHATCCQQLQHGKQWQDSRNTAYDKHNNVDGQKTTCAGAQPVAAFKV